MSFDRIVCLANSYKHENRCVAGISLITKRWVRLIGQTVPGCLTQAETCFEDGREAAILDVFEVELDQPCASNCHPEDVHVTGERWRLVRRFERTQDSRFLADYVNKAPAVLQGYSDRIYARKIEGAPVDKSLELICPSDLWWWIRIESGKRKNRALFRVGTASRTHYELAVTDPSWLEKMRALSPGIYPHAQFIAANSKKTFLTVSLSEPFEGFHYKLVAGVVNLPN